MESLRQNRRGFAIAAASLAAACVACGAPEAVDGPPPSSPSPAASVDKSPARRTIDLGSKRKTALVEAFYPASLVERTAAAKTPNN